VRDEDAYKKTYPVDRLVKGMMAPGMVLKTVEILRVLLKKECWQIGSSIIGPVEMLL
jgi:hypothetical protein